jgi:hypothetical protein
MDHPGLFQKWFDGPSWDGWRAILKATFGLSMSESERAFFRGVDDDVLVIKAPSLVLNPTLDRTIIDKALEDDPAAGRSEWLGEFRDDVASWIDPRPSGLASSAAVASCPRAAARATSASSTRLADRRTA